MVEISSFVRALSVIFCGVCPKFDVESGRGASHVYSGHLISNILKLSIGFRKIYIFACDNNFLQLHFYLISSVKMSEKFDANGVSQRKRKALFDSLSEADQKVSF